MKYVILRKDMDDQVANRLRFERYGNKAICRTCKFFSDAPGSEWGICHSPAFNRSVEVTMPTGKATLEDAGGSMVRGEFSCLYWKARGDTVEGAGNPPWGYGVP